MIDHRLQRVTRAGIVLSTATIVALAASCSDEPGTNASVGSTSGGDGGATSSSAGSGGSTSSAGGEGGATSASSSSASSSSASSSSSSSSSASSSSSGGGMICVPGSSMSCYSGPPKTEGVGTCAAGMQICAPDGLSYGPCAGEVLPAIDDCKTPADEDCNGVVSACLPQPAFAALYGGAGDDVGRSVAVDASGNVFVLARTTGTVDFGGGPIGGSGAGDAILVKLDPQGAHLWSKSFGTGTPQLPQSVAVDPQGDAIVFGTFDGTIDFGAGPLTAQGGSSLFLAKFDPAGALLFAKAFPVGKTTSDGIDWVVKTGPSSEIVIASSFKGTLDLGAQAHPSVGENDVFVAKFDAAGAYLWSKRFGDAASQMNGDVAVGDDGGVILTGAFRGTIDFGGGPMTAFAGGGSKEIDVYVARLDAQGDFVWAKQFGGAGPQLGSNVATDAAGDVFVTGFSTGAIDLGGGPIGAGNPTPCFVAKLSPAGAHLWSRAFGCHIEQVGPRVAVDAAGRVAGTGYFQGTSDFGGGPLKAAGGGLDVFSYLLDAGGAHLGSFAFGAAGTDQGRDIVASPKGGFVLTGAVSGPVDLGGGPLVHKGGYDIFVLQSAP